MLVISYESYRAKAMAVNAIKDVGLLVCDEAHRLKGGDDRVEVEEGHLVFGVLLVLVHAVQHAQHVVAGEGCHGALVRLALRGAGGGRGGR